MTLAKCHLSVLCHFQRASPPKVLSKFQSDFICSLQAKGEKKVHIFGPSQMTKMAAMPIHEKKNKNLHL